MKTKYRVRWATSNFVEILELQFANETESFIIFDNGSHEKKKSGFNNWFDTEDEAIAFIYSENEKLIDIAKKRLQYAVDNYDEIKQIIKNRKK